MRAWLDLFFVSLLLQSYRNNIIHGAVILSPSEIAQGCVGEELEFTCNVTGILLEWTFPRVSEAQAQIPFRRAITAEGPAKAQTFQVTDNTTTYSFTRTSAEGSPVSSTLLINAVGNGHNGTEITCSDVSSQIAEAASTTIVVIDSQIQDSDTDELNIISEQFKRQYIIVIVEWIQRNPLYSYYVNVTPPVQHHFDGTMNISVLMTLFYNISYNMTIRIAHICPGIVFEFIQQFYYTYCSNPAHQIEDPVVVYGYMNPAIPGRSVTFHCSSPGYSLVGSNVSTCLGNGEWEPDPREEIKCKANCGTPSLPPNCHTITYTSTLEEAEVVFECKSTFQVWHWYLCKEVNVTAVCTKEGNWEPITSADDNIMCTKLTGHLLNQDKIIAIASSISVFVITSILFSVFGCFCGFHYRKQMQNPPSSENQPTPTIYDDVVPKDDEQKFKLQQNTAYATVYRIN